MALRKLCKGRRRIGIFFLCVVSCVFWSVVARAFTTWERDVALTKARFDQREIVIASDSKGGAFIAWEDRRDFSIRVHRIDGAGNKLWDSPRSVARTDWPKFYPTLIEDGSGGIIVAWAEGRQGWCNFGFMAQCDVYAQRIGSDGSRMWTATGVPVSLAEANQGITSIAAAPDGNGGVYLAWEDARPTCCKIFAQHLWPDGAPSWAVDGIRLSAKPRRVIGPMGLRPVHLIADGFGGVIAGWREEQSRPLELRVQRINRQGRFLWGVDGRRIAETCGGDFSMVSDEKGGALFAFAVEGPAHCQIAVQRGFSAVGSRWKSGGAGRLLRLSG
jgi:hypothetical protein